MLQHRSVLISAHYFQGVINHYQPLFNQKGISVIIPTITERLSEEELLPLVHDIDGAICGDDEFTEKVLRSAPKLKVISKWGTGIDSINQVVCRQLGIRVCNTPDAFTEAVADSALGSLLAFARRIPWVDKEMKHGQWNKQQGFALHEKTLGIIGLGHIGLAVAKRARAFGMSILVNDILPIPDEVVERYDLLVVEKNELFRRSDVICLCCDLNPTSHHVLNTEAFRQMERCPLIINMARGPLIREADLISALQQNAVAGAALDVFEQEPLPLTSPLRGMDTVLLSPHNANSSRVAWDRVHERTVNNLLEGLGIEL